MSLGLQQPGRNLAGRVSLFENTGPRTRIRSARHPSQRSSHTFEKLFFLARRVTLVSSKIWFIVLIVRRSPVADRRLRWRVRLAIIAPIVPSGLRTSVIWVHDAHLTVGRRPALVHRRVAASIVWAGSEGDDVQANGKSRIVSLSPGVLRC
jgi:hypothetical protein